MSVAPQIPPSAPQPAYDAAAVSQAIGTAEGALVTAQAALSKLRSLLPTP